MELFRSRLQIENELTLGFAVYNLQEVGVKTWVSRLCFSPDGNPLVSMCRANRAIGALAVMAGFLQGGGVGKSLAEWMIHGEPEAMYMAWMWRVTAATPKISAISRKHRPVLFTPICDDLS